MNKRCVAFTKEEYEKCIQLLHNGFRLPSGVVVKPNERIAVICQIEAVLGVRLGDVLNLKLESFIRDGDNYRLDIIEQKTRKHRRFTVPTAVYSFIQDYALNNGISRGVKLFPISSRQVERHLNKVFEKMSLPICNYGSHSFRKFFASRVYIENGYDVELVRILLQHSNVSITQRYLGVSQKAVEDAIAKTVAYLV